MRMKEGTETSTAWDVAQEAAKEGVSGTDIAEKMQREAEQMRRAAEEVRRERAEVLQSVAQVTGTESGVIKPDEIEALKRQGIIDRGSVITVGAHESPETLERVAQSVSTTADDIRSVVGGMKTGVLEGGTAGQAYQGQAGSTVIDVTSAMHGAEDGSVIVDTTMLDDVKKHELRHEVQAGAWTATTVDIGGETLSRMEVSEFDAMKEQTTIAFVSADYKAIFRKVAGLGVEAEVRKVAAETGDLAQLGRTIREKRGAASAEDRTQPALAA